MRKKTLCVVPFGNISHPAIDGDDLFHQATQMTVIDNKRKWLGWYAINFCAMVSDDVLAVVPAGDGIGTQQLKVLINRFCEPFFIPNEVMVTSAPSLAPTLSEELLAALSHESAATVDDVVLVMPNQVLEVTSTTLMTFKNGNSQVLLSPVSNAKKAPHSVKSHVYVAPDEDDTVKMACSYDQMVELGTLEPFKGVVSAVRLDADDLRRALQSGTSVEEHVCKVVVGQTVGKVDARQGFY